MSSHDKELPMISSIIVLANEGKRIASRYYQNACPDLKSQLAFEKKLYQKTHRTNARSDAEVVLFEKYIVVYKYIADVFFYVCAPSEENELVVLSVLNCLEDSLQTLLQNQVSKATLMDYEIACLMLAIDEIVDDGLILELDPSLVVNRVAMKEEGEEHGDVTFEQAFKSARDQLVKTFSQ